MKKELFGSIKELFISKKNVDSIICKAFLELDENGIKNDKFYAKDLSRSILITSIFAYDLLNKHNITAPFGSLGENLLVTFNPYDLQSGTKISIGETILEITNECTICNHLSKLDAKVPALLKNDRGVFAKVIQGGIIKINDSIDVIN